MRSTPAWWGPGLLAVAAVAIVLRVVFTLAVAPDLPPPGDAEVYRTTAHHLAEGDGLSYPAPGDGPVEANAEHPPLFPVLLAGMDVVGLDSVTAQGLALSVLSGLGIVLVALVGRRVGGPAVGLTGAAIAAVHPMWTQSPGLVLSESLHLVLVPLVLLLGLELLERPRWAPAAFLGGAVALAGLGRPEGLALFVVVVVPAVVLGAPRRGDAIRLVAVAGGVVLLLVVPWLVRNDAQVGGLTMSTNGGKTLLGSNCDAAYGGPRLGGFDSDCFFGAAAYLVQTGPTDGGTWTAKTFDDAMGASGRKFISEHRGDLPKVVVARVARMWGLAFAADQRRFDVEEGRDPTWQGLGQLLHLVLLPFAVGGAVLVLRSASWRRGIVLLGPILLVTATCLIVYGGTRMRSGAEPSVAVFAAVGVVGAVRALRRSGGGVSELEASGGSVLPA